MPLVPDTMLNDDEESNATSIDPSDSKALNISQVFAAPNPPLQPVKSPAASDGGQRITTISERPALFGPLWKEITIVLLCCCGPITMVYPFCISR